MKRKNRRNTKQFATAVPVSVIASAIKPAITIARIINPSKVRRTAFSFSTYPSAKAHRTVLISELTRRTDVIQVMTADIKLRYVQMRFCGKEWKKSEPFLSFKNENIL